MKTVELFSGTKSFSKVADDLGHDTFTIDNDPIGNPDLCRNILDVEIDDIPFKPDIIWASPPCQTFSVASIGHHWTFGKKGHVPKSEACKIGLNLLEQTIQIITESNPKYWIIENPRGVMRKIINPIFNRNSIWNNKRHTVTYCQYGDDRMKPTDLWHNIPSWEPKPMCKNGDPCHESAPRGSKTGTQGLKDARKRGVIPPGLFYEIFDVIAGVEE